MSKKKDAPNIEFHHILIYIVVYWVRVIKRLATIDFLWFFLLFHSKVYHGRNPIHKTHNCHYVINHFFLMMLLGYMYTAWVFLLVKNNIFTGVFCYGYNQINLSSGIVKILRTMFFVERSIVVEIRMVLLIVLCCRKVKWGKVT